MSLHRQMPRPQTQASRGSWVLHRSKTNSLGKGPNTAPCSIQTARHFPPTRFYSMFMTTAVCVIHIGEASAKSDWARLVRRGLFFDPSRKRVGQEMTFALWSYEYEFWVRDPYVARWHWQSRRSRSVRGARKARQGKARTRARARRGGWRGTDADPAV